MSALGRQARRVLWHLNRSPAGVAIKATLGLVRRADVNARKRLSASLPADAVSTRLAADLDRDGYVRLDGQLDAALLAELGAAGQTKLEHALAATGTASRNHKKFWDRLLDEDMVDGRLAVENPFVRFAMQPRVVGVVSKVLGQVPKLDYVLLTLSHASDEPLSYSQLWHRDHDDVRVIKLFVYLTDVATQDDGPFTFIAGPASDRCGFSLHSHRGDDEIFQRIQRDEVQAMIAPRLSVFMVETSRCLHMGSRMAQGHQRLLYTATYFAAPRMFPKPPARFGESVNIDEVGRKMLAPI
jgi:hypothetical protein